MYLITGCFDAAPLLLKGSLFLQYGGCWDSHISNQPSCFPGKQRYLGYCDPIHDPGEEGHPTLGHQAVITWFVAGSDV